MKQNSLPNRPDAAPPPAEEDVSLTMATRIERAVRRDIIDGVIAPGDWLRTTALSARYGTSAIPVREALRQLEGDRLVVIESRKGAVVRRVDRKFVIDLHDTREAIEALLIRNAACNATVTDLDELKRRGQAYESAAAVLDQARMVEANRQFHRCIARIADNAEAAQILERGWELVIGLTNRFGRGPARVAQIIREHCRMVQAVVEGDVERAMAAAHEHCESAKQDILLQMGRVKQPAAYTATGSRNGWGKFGGP